MQVLPQHLGVNKEQVLLLDNAAYKPQKNDLHKIEVDLGRIYYRSNGSSTRIPQLKPRS